MSKFLDLFSKSFNELIWVVESCETSVLELSFDENVNTKKKLTKWLSQNVVIINLV